MNPKLPRGAIPTPRNVLGGAEPFHVKPLRSVAPPSSRNILAAAVPFKPHEALLPENFSPYFSSQSKLQYVGNGISFMDDSKGDKDAREYYFVDWKDELTLRAAIAYGEVIVGVAGKQLAELYRQEAPIFALKLKCDDNYNASAYIVGYGCLGFLCKELHVPIPDVCDGQSIGYIIAFEGRLGIIDAISLQNIVCEAWVAKFTNGGEGYTAVEKG